MLLSLAASYVLFFLNFYLIYINNPCQLCIFWLITVLLSLKKHFDALSIPLFYKKLHVFQSAMYHIWWEGNARRHGKQHSPASRITKLDLPEISPTVTAWLCGLLCIPIRLPSPGSWTKVQCSNLCFEFLFKPMTHLLYKRFWLNNNSTFIKKKHSYN